MGRTREAMGGRGWWRPLGVIGLAAGLLALVPSPPAVADHGPCHTTSGVTTCVFEPGAFGDGGIGTTWTVPAGVTEVRFQVNGAQGGGPRGGLGGRVEATAPVTPGQRFRLLRGGRGGEYSGANRDGGGRGGFVDGAQGGFSPESAGVPGGGGGASSTVRLCDLSGCGGADLITAGGGGGGGGAIESATAGHGGGGGLAGGAGTDGTSSFEGAPGGGGGGGGTPGAGGTAGELRDDADAPERVCAVLPVAGQPGEASGSGTVGGAGGSGCGGGGGGGGGVSGGGGGGGGHFAGGGGGGGTSAIAWTGTTDVTFTTGAHEGAGLIVITYGELDETGPETTIDLDPAAPDGSDGWYVSTPDVTVSAVDATGVVAEIRCVVDPATAPSSFDDLPAGSCTPPGDLSDGHHVLHAAAIDDSGNAGAVVSAAWKVDRTGPALQPVVSPNPVLIGGDATAEPGASDDASGVASSSCDAVDTSVAGPRTVTCRAADIAGNTTEVQASYTVGYGFIGFHVPVDNDATNWIKAGQTVPLRWQLVDADGAPIEELDPAAVSVHTVPCGDDPGSAGADAPSDGDLGLQHLGNGEFQYDWKTSPDDRGTCRTVVLDVGDGLLHTADFNHR